MISISMQFSHFLIKYGEIAVKGKNRNVFEDALGKQMRIALRRVEGSFEVEKKTGRFYVHCSGDYDYEGAVSALQKVFGIVGICPVYVFEDEGMDALKQDVCAFVGEMYPDRHFTFKVRARRGNKKFPKNSMEINAEAGEALLERFPEMKVDVHDPDVTLYIEVREAFYIYSTIIPGAGGMPVGTAGKAMLLLSGGIDSPVAGVRIAKRGAFLEAVYFHAPPYTSERAKEKVVDLAKIMAEYTGGFKLHVVNFTDIQMDIYEKCPHEELTIIMRRYMMRIAEAFALRSDCLGLVTGESIGQVASQTMQSLRATNEVCTLPVYRPLIGFDKQEIIDEAEKIGTFETSILPYEDCCTIFVAKHPVTKPDPQAISASEKLLGDEIEIKVQQAIETAEEIRIRPRSQPQTR